MNSSPCGRFTRGFITSPLSADGSLPSQGSKKPHRSIDSSGKLFWLKDCWRVAHSGKQREGDILRELNDSDVVGVPTLVCHGDVDSQRTWSQELSSKPYPSEQPTNCSLNTLIHYRMVVAEVCLPLKFFRSGRELLRLIIDCILGK